MAGNVILVLPLLIAFFCAQNRIVHAFTYTVKIGFQCVGRNEINIQKGRYHSMKRCLSMFLVLVLVFSFCGNALAEDGKTVIHFWHCHSGAAADAHAYLVDAFNASRMKLKSY